MMKRQRGEATHTYTYTHTPHTHTRHDYTCIDLQNGLLITKTLKPVRQFYFMLGLSS